MSSKKKYRSPSPSKPSPNIPSQPEYASDPSLHVPSSPEAAHGGGSPPKIPSEFYRPSALWILLVVICIGIGIAVHLTRIHLDLKFGQGSLTSLCDFGVGLNCKDVLISPYAMIFNWIPLSVLAISAYAVMAMLALRAISTHEQETTGLIALMGAVSLLVSVILFFVSSVVIGTLCPFCISLYLVNICTLVLPIAASRQATIQSLRFGLRAFRNRRLLVLSTLNGLLVLALSMGGYSRAKDALVAETTAVLQNPATPEHAKAGSSGSTAAGPAIPANSLATDSEALQIDTQTAVAGASDARVTIVVFEDFECGFCKLLTGNLKQLLEKFPNDLRIAFRHFPMHKDCNDANIAKSMHPNACRASIAAECAREQDHFWPYYYELFKNQSDLGVGDLRQFAQTLQLDVSQFDICIASPEAKNRVREDSRKGAALNVSGTPTFFINGRRFSGALSVEVLSAIVAGELEGKQLSMAQLKDVEKSADVTGLVTGPEMTTVEGPHGKFKMDTFEAAIVGGKAVSKVGAKATTEVSWFDADKACRAAGKRLCTDAEWLTACRGEIAQDTDGNGEFHDDRARGTAYPYGDFYQAGVCNDQVEPPAGLKEGETPPVPDLITGNHPKCKSKAGIFDLAGSVREWTGTVAQRSAYVGGAFYSRADAACGSRNESSGPFLTSDALGFRCCRGDAGPPPPNRPGRQVGDKLRPFEGKTIDGQPFYSASLQGHPTLITFWASWCGPCRKELPAYASIYPALQTKGFRIVAINVDTEVEKARLFLKEHPLNFDVVLDTTNALLQSFDTKAMPTSFLIDIQGNIRQRKTGFDSGDEKRLETTAEKMLHE